MFVLFILLSLVVSFRILLGFIKYSKRRFEWYESLFCIVIYLLLIILAMFRGESVGVDTADYIADYKDVSIMTFSDILEHYKGYQGFYLLSKFFSILDFPCYAWFGFIELVLVSALARFINKYSHDKLFSLLIFITTGLYMFSLAGLKQTLAMGIVFHAYIDFTEKHYFRTLILTLFAYTIHLAALLGNIMLVFYLIRNKKSFYPTLIMLSATILIGGMIMLSQLVLLSGNEHYEMYFNPENHSYASTTLYLYLLILAFTIPFIKSYLRDDNIAKVALAGSLLVCTFQYLSSYSASLFRLAYCFMPFLIVYVPNVFAQKNSTTILKAFRLLTMFVLIFFCLYTNRNLIFTFA